MINSLRRLELRFKEVLKDEGAKVLKTANRSPNTVAHVERFIQTMQQEVLGYFVVFGKQHMYHLVSKMLEYYHQERPHQSKENAPLVVARAGKAKGKRPPPNVAPVSSVTCRQRLGGLLKHYFRDAA